MSSMKIWPGHTHELVKYCIKPKPELENYLDLQGLESIGWEFADLIQHERVHPSILIQDYLQIIKLTFLADVYSRLVQASKGNSKYEQLTNDLLGPAPIDIHVFDRMDCEPCPVRSRCTHRAKGARTIGLIDQAHFIALRQARQRHAQDSFNELYAVRAGIEGTLSWAVNICGTRRSRYIGLAKTHLQQVLTALALNLTRTIAWLDHTPHAKTRVSPFAALAT